MRLYTPPSFAVAPPQPLRPALAPALQKLPSCAPRFQVGRVGDFIRGIENGTFGNRGPDTKAHSIGVPGRLQPPRFVRNAATLPLPHTTSPLQPAADYRLESSPRFIKHALSGSARHGIGPIASRIERRNQNKPQVFATPPMREGQAGAPPPRRSEFHPNALLRDTSPALDAPPNKSVVPLDLQDMTYTPLNKPAGPGSIASDCDSDDGWGSDFDSEDEQGLEELGADSEVVAECSDDKWIPRSDKDFEDLWWRLKKALPYLPRRPQSTSPGQVPTSPVPSSNGGSDNGYESDSDSLGASLRLKLALHAPELQAYDELPESEKQTTAAASESTFARMIERGRKTLKTRTHTKQPARPTSATDVLLDQIQNFKLADLKPVDPSAPQINKIRVTPADDKSLLPQKVDTRDALLRVMATMPTLDKD